MEPTSITWAFAGYAYHLGESGLGYVWYGRQINLLLLSCTLKVRGYRDGRGALKLQKLCFL